MKIRINTLWRVPVFCLVSSWVSFYLTVYLGRFFFIVKTVGVDGVTGVSVDPLRSAIFSGGLFLIVLLLGGLWAFRTMTRAEIAVSAAIISAIYFFLTLMQLYLPHFPVTISVKLATFLNWKSILSSGLLKITGSLNLSVLLADLAPFLFVLFGKKRFTQAS